MASTIPIPRSGAQNGYGSLFWPDHERVAGEITTASGGEKVSYGTTPESVNTPSQLVARRRIRYLKVHD